MSKYKLSEDEFIKQWEIKRKKGFFNYILIQGGISWGIFSAIIYMFFIFIAKFFIEMPPESSLLMKKWFQLIVFFIFGLVLGIVNWHKNEKRYLKRKPYKKKKKM
ncbi:MAG: hypothetical protein ACQEQE_00560 [Bacillota bacterium]